MRLFVAIELEASIRKSIGQLQSRLARSCEGVRWVPVEQVHLTVKFLGEVPDANVAKVTAAVSAAAGRSSAFSMTVAGCGCFPPGGSARIAWCGATDESGRLLQCVDAAENEMESLGFAREQRAFAPHITIGRVKEDRSHGQIRAAIAAAKFDAMSQEVSSLTLMSSTLSPKGATYTPVIQARFQAA